MLFIYFLSLYLLFHSTCLLFTSGFLPLFSSPFFFASLTISFLLQIGAQNVHCDVSAVDKEFRTPLHWAAVLGLSEVVGLLMEKGANPQVKDGTGASALRYAVSN